MHWVISYIGLRWVPYATGPYEFDCWGLVFHCLREHYGVSVERFINVVTDDHKAIHRAFESEAKKPEWISLTEPQEGAVVMMTERDRFFHHIGIYTNGRVLHSRDGANVALESVERIQQNGIKKLKYYIHESIFNATA